MSSSAAGIRPALPAGACCFPALFMAPAAAQSPPHADCSHLVADTA